MYKAFRPIIETNYNYILSFFSFPSWNYSVVFNRLNGDSFFYIILPF